MKKAAIFIFIVLLLMSLYKDLTSGVTIKGKEKTPEETITPNQSEIKKPPLRFDQKVPVKIKSGDTVLSIMEKLHNGEYVYSIEMMLQDFVRLNPGTDPSAIKIDHVYYFPMYDVKVNGS
ncbi:hypothetical protein [Thalassobacillus pellis]|uniref:hypothetical protein n=1 Tax=Thalassobacillus pellis TaxID=748008 RepID=UPI0019600510|nr:hypothetical protein [Thalassobacillus pellis]MBM7554752.1 hypothetical protein [Thalassobacillus pellis]